MPALAIPGFPWAQIAWPIRVPMTVPGPFNKQVALKRSVMSITACRGLRISLMEHSSNRAASPAWGG